MKYEWKKRAASFVVEVGADSVSYGVQCYSVYSVYSVYGVYRFTAMPGLHVNDE
jgi:hypothetical protein